MSRAVGGGGFVETYQTVGRQSEVEIVIKKSRFIGRAAPVASEEEAVSLLEAIRRKHWDATHNCYAYTIGPHSEIQRSSDDGEPAGTAGRPILEVLHHMNLRDTLVVVTRYFGGVLLGAGGLVRAYGHAASEAVRAAGLLSRRPYVRVRIRIPYPAFGKLDHRLAQRGWPREEPVFAEDVRLTVYVPRGREHECQSVAADATGGQVDLRFEEEVWLDEVDGAARVPSSLSGDFSGSNSPEG